MREVNICHRPDQWRAQVSCRPCDSLLRGRSHPGEAPQAQCCAQGVLINTAHVTMTEEPEWGEQEEAAFGGGDGSQLEHVNSWQSPCTFTDKPATVSTQHLHQ